MKKINSIVYKVMLGIFFATLMVAVSVTIIHIITITKGIILSISACISLILTYVVYKKIMKE